MPRKPRIEYAGAVYHILNRGNYRQDLFTVSGSTAAFEKVLFDSCDRFGWQLYAYVILSNHFHLCLKTQDANLVVGMQWLQSTFANRFNRFVNERGHVFQGRYQALLVEEGSSLLRVVNYIHLNPVRAGLQSIETLKEHSASSFPKYFQRRHPTCLTPADWLLEAGSLKPTAVGFRRYHKLLALTVESDPNKRQAQHQELCRGWFIGTREGKKAILEDMETGARADGYGVKGYGEEYAQDLLQEGLSRLDKGGGDVVSDSKLAAWKVVLASWIKLQCGVGNRWFSEHLCMGNIYNLSKAVSIEQKQGNRRKGNWRKLGIPNPKA